jgi:hypothetical protein
MMRARYQWLCRLGQTRLAGPRCQWSTSRSLTTLSSANRFHASRRVNWAQRSFAVEVIRGDDNDEDDDDEDGDEEGECEDEGDDEDDEGQWEAAEGEGDVETIEIDMSEMDFSKPAREVRRKDHTNYQFVDHSKLEVKGGRGGNGCVSFEGLG